MGFAFVVPGIILVMQEKIAKFKGAGTSAWLWLGVQGSYSIWIPARNMRE
jgi:hypothetical protein